MKLLKVKKNGKIFLESTIEEKVKIEKVKNIKEYLACEIEFENGVTFETFFNLILKEKDFFDAVFSQELNGKKLKDFEEKLKEEVVKDPNEDFKIDYLEVSKVFELFSFEKISTIDLFPVFIGIGKTIEGLEVFIPISLCSVSELKNLEILPNKIVEVYREVQSESIDEDYDEDEDGDLEEGSENEYVFSFFEAATRISLYETIQCILYELSYYKSDEERIKVRKDQNNEQNSKNKIAILEVRLKSHIDNEEFEKASIVKRELDKLKTAISANK